MSPKSNNGKKNGAKSTVVTTITVPRSLHTKVKMQAIKQNRSASSIYSEAAQEFLQASK